jgi:hypothetical protein
MQQAKRLTQDIQAAKAPQKLLSLLQQHAADLNHIHISAAFTSAVKLCSRGVESEQQSAALQQLLRHLHQLAEQQQQQCDARGLANIMWSCGRLRYPATVQLLLPELLQSGKLQQANPQDVSNTLWAATTLGAQLGEGGVQQLVQQFVHVLPQAKPQEVSNTLWAAATMGEVVPAHQLDQLLTHLKEHLPQCNHKDIASIAWGCD